MEVGAGKKKRVAAKRLTADELGAKSPERAVFMDIRADIRGKLSMFYKWIAPNSSNKTINFYTLKWVRAHLERIVDKIEEYNNVNTKKTYYNALTVLFRSDAFKDVNLHKRFSALGIKYNNMSNEQEDEQKLSPEEEKNWKSYADILAIRDKLKAAIKPRNFYSHRAWLVCTLHTLQPPLRGNYGSMEIIYKRDHIKPDRNYWLIDKETGTQTLIIQKDKVAARLHSSEIPVEPAVAKIMLESLAEYPRSFVCTKNGGGITDAAYTNMLREKIGVGVDNLRSAYITNYHPGMTIGQKKGLAQKMRHSREAAEKNYFKMIQSKDISKVIPEELREPADVAPEELGIERVPLSPAESAADKPLWNRKEWAKKYRAAHKEKIATYMKEYKAAMKDQIMRNKMLYDLNVGHITKPRPETIKKYSLIYNAQTKLWESTAPTVTLKERKG